MKGQFSSCILALTILTTLSTLGSVASSTFQSIDLERFDGSLSVDRMGHSMDMDHNRLVVGAPRDQYTGDGGTVLVYRKSPTDPNARWELEATLRSWASGTGPESGDMFGVSVAIDGELIAVGGRGRGNVLEDNFGVVYVFAATVPGDPSQGYTGKRKLKGTPGHWGDGFGLAISLRHGFLAVGSPLFSTYGSRAGAVYTFQQFDQRGSPNIDLDTEQRYQASDLEEHTNFGRSVALYDDLLVIGSNSHRRNDNGGTMYIMERSGSGFDQAGMQTLRASVHIPNAHDFFGTQVAVTSQYIAVSAPGDDNGSGKVYIFSRRGDLLFELFCTECANGDRFGASLAMNPSDESLVVGAHLAGAAYYYTKDAGTDTWSNGVVELLPSVGAPGDWFGYAVAVSDHGVAVGAPRASTSSAGTLYAFDPENAIPSPTAFPTLSTPPSASPSSTPTAPTFHPTGLDSTSPTLSPYYVIPNGRDACPGSLPDIQHWHESTRSNGVDAGYPEMIFRILCCSDP